MKELMQEIRAFLSQVYGDDWGFSVLASNPVKIWIMHYPPNVEPTVENARQLGDFLKKECPALADGTAFKVEFAPTTAESRSVADAAAGVGSPKAPAQLGPTPEQEINTLFAVPKLSLRRQEKWAKGTCVFNRCKGHVVANWQAFDMCQKHVDMYRKKTKKTPELYIEPMQEVLAATVLPPPAESVKEATAIVEAESEALTVAPIPKVNNKLLEKESYLQTMIQQLGDFQIVDQGGLDIASSVLKDIKKIAKETLEERKALTKPLKDHTKTVESWYKPALDFCKVIEDTLKAKVLAAQATFAQQRAQAQAQAQAAFQAQDHAQVHQSLIAAEAAVPDMGAMQIRENWTYEIVDVRAVPHEFMMVDERKVSQVVKAMKGATNIAGIRVFDAQTLAVPSK